MPLAATMNSLKTGILAGLSDASPATMSGRSVLCDCSCMEILPDSTSSAGQKRQHLLCLGALSA